MKIEVLRTAQTIKCDKEDNIWYGPDYDMNAFYNPKIQATMVRIHNNRKHKTVYTTFANVAYCEVAEGEFIKAEDSKASVTKAKGK